MSKSDLKAAMDSLQVNKPLKLTMRAPQFKAPESTTQVAMDTEVEKGIQVKKGTPVEVPTGDLYPALAVCQSEVEEETRVPNSTQAEPPTPVVNETRVGEATQEPAKTEVAKATEVHKITEAQSAEPREFRAGEQDSSVVLEAQAASKLHLGYTRIPNSILMQMISGDLSKGEIKVLLLVARFTISFQRKYAPLSKTVIERQTGLRGPSVLQSLSDLVAKGLLEKIPGDQHKPNQFGLVFEDEWNFTGPKRVKKPDSAQVENAAEAQKEARAGNMTPVEKPTAAPVSFQSSAGVEKTTDYKQIETNQNKLSLPEHPILERYFSELKPAKKRESELKAFRGLQEDYSQERIADCLVQLQKVGISNGEDFERCHSPMGFLSKAIDQVISEIDSGRRKMLERIEKDRHEQEAVRRRAEEEAREARESVEMELAFSRAYQTPERQQEVIRDLCTGLPFRPESIAARTLAIGRWWQSLNSSERNELSTSQTAD